MTETILTVQVHVTPGELLQALENHPNKGTKIVSFIVATHPKLTKKNRRTGEPCPHTAGVTRIASRRVMLGADYGNAVNGQRSNEGITPDFNPQSLWNGHGVHHGPYTVQHDTSGRISFFGRPQQLAITDNAAGRMCIVDADEWQDTATGEPVDPATLVDYLPPLRKADNQGVRHDIQWRIFPLDEIMELTYAGICYVVHQEMQLVAADDSDSNKAA